MQRRPVVLKVLNFLNIHYFCLSRLLFLVASFVSMCNEMHDIPVNLPECSHRAA